MQDIVKFKSLRNGEDAGFCDLVHLVKRCYNTLKDIGMPSDMDMCADERKVWSRDLEKTKQPSSLNQLMTCMTVEMKSRMRATVPLRASNGSFSVHNVIKINDDGIKLPITSVGCARVRLIGQINVRNLQPQMPTTASNPVKDNHACFSCLKRAVGDHRISNYSRRKQCTEKENGVHCPWYHHPLLHKSTDLRVSISSVTDNQDALLPVIAVDISGQGGLYKRGNILLDSGAQITLIRVETAESLGLEGKNVSISDEGIIRVGGRMDKAIVSYEAKHPALLPHDHKISRLITQEAHSSQNENKELDLASSWPGEDNQIQVCHLQRNGAKDRDADYGRLT